MIRSILLASLTFGLLYGAAQTAPAADDAISPHTKKINELIAAKWKERGITKPADKATDLEFMRRVFIDLLGRIPTVEEIRDYEQDKGANKRTRLVERLLYDAKYTPKANGKALKDIPSLSKVPINYSRQFASNFAELWSVWLLTRSGVDEVYREAFEIWLEEQFDKNVPYRDFVTSLITATGKSNENAAIHFVFRHLGDPLQADSKGERVELDKFGKYDNVPITSRVTRMFLGIQTQCTQCHDHPQAKEWVQKDFWGVNAFFRQTEKRGAQTAMNRKGTGVVASAIELNDLPNWNKDGLVLFDRRDGRRDGAYATMLKDMVQAEKGEASTKKLTGSTAPADKSRRQVLAEWVVQHDNFEKAFVNRMWGHFFGRGLHQEPTVDDFRIENTIVHPELLSYLAGEFKRYNYDTKKLIEWICTSDVYQLSHVASKEKIDDGNGGKKSLTETEFDAYFARMPLKAQSPEAIFESLSIATRARARLGEDSFKPLKRSWSARLVRNFGDDEGNESNFNGTIVQALLMMNGRDLNDQIKSDKTKGVVADVVVRHARGGPSNIYDELFLMTVSRHPTPEEVKKLEEVRNGRASIKLGNPTPAKGPKNSGATPVAGAMTHDINFYEDVFWALLNTNEFMLNH